MNGSHDTAAIAQPRPRHIVARVEGRGLQPGPWVLVEQAPRDEQSSDPEPLPPIFVQTERARVRVTALERGDANALVATLGRCSATTRYHRFHGITDGVPHVTQMLVDTAGQDAVGAWCADKCVGFASLAVDGDGSTHIGVLVEDEWQRQGVGSALMAALLHRARQRRLPSLIADVLAEDLFILPLLARIGPITTSSARGSHTVRLNLGSHTVT
jgi:GNAT superfamily N-acetyltransferase